jgi:hypothetical protein
MQRRLARKKHKLNRFGAVLDLIMASGDLSGRQLLGEIGVEPTEHLISSLGLWQTGKRRPRVGKYLRVLDKIEERFCIPKGRLADLVGGCSSTYGQIARHLPPSQQQILRWHTPDDFDLRPETERREIVSWIRANVFPATTDYGKRIAERAGVRYGIVFPTLPRSLGGRRWLGKTVRRKDVVERFKRNGTIPAPPHLVEEMLNLADFATGTLPPKGYRRHRRWAKSTAKTRILQCGAILGALASAPDGETQGLGVPTEHLTIALFLFPQMWDWWLEWSEKRRGFLVSRELSALHELKSLTRRPQGWLRQNPHLAAALRPIKGLVSEEEIERAKRDWVGTCDTALEYACARIPEVRTVIRISRDPVVPVETVLSAGNPLRVYKKIGDEILKQMPGEKEAPFARAAAVRGYLVFRLAMHLGVRQRNLRELLLCLPGNKPRSVSKLEELKRGELRWNEANRTWDVYIPALGIKNGSGGFFNGRPYHTTLPDIDGLYHWINLYVERYRGLLLRGYRDTGTFFVRNLRGRQCSAEFDVTSFYALWKRLILKYGIFNPYTGRGAIKGLLPHGPHTARDVLATHLIKKTGSYELAAAAIQDSLEMVMHRYAHILPNEKIARAAKELNKEWRK